MKKIRIPRKLKKNANILLNKSYCFPEVPKLQKYYSYLDVEDGIKRYNMSAEQLYYSFGRFTMDDIIWWNWVRWKKLNVKPEMSEDFQEYWNYFVEKGIIKK